MHIETRQYADVVVVSAEGRVDHHSAADFEAGLMPHVHEAAKRDGVLVLDMAGVSYMSSVGLRVLMLASKATRGVGGKVLVASLTDTLSEIFEISRFNYVFSIFPDVPAALADASADAHAAFEAQGPGAP